MQRSCVFPVERDGLCSFHYRDIQGKLTGDKTPYYETGHTEHVLIRGDVFKYQEKAPFVRSGVSVCGAIEYDSALDHLRCHECGEFFQNLGTHIPFHEMSQGEYREKHGIARQSPLANCRLRNIRKSSAEKRQQWKTGKQFTTAQSALRAGKKAKNSYIMLELLNARGSCRIQLLGKIAEYAKEVGRTPTRKELLEMGVEPTSLRRYFGSIGNAMKLIGLTPNSPRGWGLYEDEGSNKEDRQESTVQEQSLARELNNITV